jgi:hypothetical protein
MRPLRRILGRLQDPRAANVRHDLWEILVIALAATLCGAKTCTEFEYFGHGREELLRQFLDLKHGIPSHDTFSSVFRALDPKGLEAVLRKYRQPAAPVGRVVQDPQQAQHGGGRLQGIGGCDP